MNVRSFLAALVILIIFLVCVSLSYIAYRKSAQSYETSQQVQDLIKQLSSDVTRLMTRQQEPAQPEHVVSEGCSDKVTTHGQVWRPVQNQVKDAVVQVFAQVAELDMLQPYKTPNQMTGMGSGFFINEEGELITNAHVVDQAKGVWIQIPSLGKRILDVDIIGVSPERDVALLRVVPADLAVIKRELGKLSYLPLGDSDKVQRADEILALGYPLGQQSLKSTTGIISGRESCVIQMSAPINPGSSGGPSVNINGQVIGINSSGVTQAQNVGYIIPINDLKIVLNDLRLKDEQSESGQARLLRKPFLGVLFNNASVELTEFLGNPQPGGCYVVEVVPGSTLAKAGVERGDMLYELNGNRIDMYGDMSVAWIDDRISIVDFVNRLSIGDKIHLVFYSKGTRKEVDVAFSQSGLPTIRRVFPAYESIDYEVVAGMVVMQLSINHIQMLANGAPGLMRYTEMKSQKEPVLIITHIFPNSQLARSRTLAISSTINEVNGIKVTTLNELRDALKKGAFEKFLTIKATDNVGRMSDHVMAVLPLAKVLEEEEKLSHAYHYPISKTVQMLIDEHTKDKKSFAPSKGKNKIAV